MDSTKNNILYSTLPNTLLPISEAEIKLTQLLKDTLPKSDIANLDKELIYSTFNLNKERGNRKKRQRVVKKTQLTRKQKVKLNLLKLPKTGWSYKQLAPMRSLWLGYMRENLETNRPIPETTGTEWINYGVVLNKTEFIGADVRIVRSTVPNMVGMVGTVVLETKNTFQIVTPASKLKVILKESCVFEIVIDKVQFTIFGRSMVTKPSERSIKKIKTCLLPDL